MSTSSRYRYIGVSSLLFLGLLAIAVFGTGPIVRGRLGDVLTVMLLFSCIKIIRPNWNALWIALGVFVCAVILELLQLTSFHENFQHIPYVVEYLLGAHFDWHDFIAYAVGILGILCINDLFLEADALFMATQVTITDEHSA
ncbi:DUF2809 domain-containing protein [Candidatus Nomurabacteria bacterium]|nr:DUF2809 domain-containing protein [Candidatus Nomurabacteria bacterium]